MFYQTDSSEILRLGDVVRGYISTCPNIASPHLFTTPPENVCKVDIDLPSYSVVLSPCCSIEDGIICLTPLIQINNKVMKIPYFKEDTTRINAEVEPQYTAPSKVWDSPEFKSERTKRLAAGKGYHFYNYFVYKGDNFFEDYVVNMIHEPNITTSNYMIDFRKIYHLQCPMIKRQDELTSDDLPLLKSKYLELSVDTRKQLRDKLSHYFGRPTPEDAALIGEQRWH